MMMTHGMDAMARSRTMVDALARRLGAQLMETHISWVLLAGDVVYKIKKPVRLPFVNYSALQDRRHFCEEELRLNHRMAPGIYLGVARITGSCDAPEVEGAGQVLDYAVRMRRFPQEALFSHRLEAGTLSAQDIDQLAQLLARTHARAEITFNAFATPARRRAVALAALEGARPVLTPAERTRLQDWLSSRASALMVLWGARLAGGQVRQCHGDLHLDNIISLQGQVAAFDGVEFDPALRWVDVLDDLAFPVMDLQARGRRDLAFRLLNAWLDRTGDHAGLPALGFSVVYRALVRAQVDYLREGHGTEAAHAYARTALAWTEPAHPRLYITHGLPGSGKTFVSQRLLEQEGAIRLRSDVERKRLFGLGMLDDSRERGLNLYDADSTERTYEHLYTTAAATLRAGLPVIIDAAFLRRAERERAQALARELAVPLAIVRCSAAPAVLRERLLARRGDASEADVHVLEHLQAQAEPLTVQESAMVDARWSSVE